jgi:hypothetical protein
MVDYLKSKWGIESSRRVWMILLVFSLTGASILVVKDPIYRMLGLSVDASLWIKVPVALVTYQFLLLLVGACLGEFRFFWEKEKKLGRLLARPFQLRRADVP